MRMFYFFIFDFLPVADTSRFKYVFFFSLVTNIDLFLSRREVFFSVKKQQATLTFNFGLNCLDGVRVPLAKQKHDSNF